MLSVKFLHYISLGSQFQEIRYYLFSCVFFKLVNIFNTLVFVISCALTLLSVLLLFILTFMDISGSLIDQFKVITLAYPF